MVLLIASDDLWWIAPCDARRDQKQNVCGWPEGKCKSSETVPSMQPQHVYSSHSVEVHFALLFVLGESASSWRLSHNLNGCISPRLLELFLKRTCLAAHLFNPWQMCCLTKRTTRPEVYYSCQHRINQPLQGQQCLRLEVLEIRSPQ